MDLGLANKVALVTGSSRGLGLAIAHTLAAEGCDVVLNARNGERLERARKTFERPPQGVVADVTRPDEAGKLVRAIQEHHQRLDVLICNVGSGHSVAPGSETAEEWSRVIGLNVLSATNVIEAARGLLAQSKGSIVCISSICGVETLGAPLTYSAAKAALNAYVRGAARPFANQGVRINAVAPGNMLFPGSAWETKLAQNTQAVESMLQREVALKRLGSAAEVADFVAFVASPRASFATGAIFIVDGGQVRS